MKVKHHVECTLYGIPWNFYLFNAATLVAYSSEHFGREEWYKWDIMNECWGKREVGCFNDPDKIIPVEPELSKDLEQIWNKLIVYYER